MNEPVRVSIVSPRFGGGGAEYQMALLAGALARHGQHAVTYLARHVGEETPPGYLRLVRIGADERVPRFGYLADARALVRALGEARPSVIYQRVGCGYTGICAWYARRHGIPLVWHVAHDTDVTPQSLDGGRNFVRRALEKRSIEYGIRHACRIVVQSAHQGDLLARHYGRRADLILGNFHEEPAEAPDKSATPTVVWIANLKSWKQPEVFVRLARALRDLGNARFIMAGEAPSDPRNAAWLEALLGQIRELPNLEYVGKLSQAAVFELLGRAHVFVNTSLHEGFPNTFVQSWLRGTVVASLSVDPDGWLEKRELGILAGSEPALEEGVRRLLLDAQLRERYARVALEQARTHFSLRNAERLVELLDACTGTSGGRSSQDRS